MLVGRAKNKNKIKSFAPKVYFILRCWVLGAGCWVLGAGCWVLGAFPIIPDRYLWVLSLIMLQVFIF